jgi:hypothetical protein
VRREPGWRQISCVCNLYRPTDRDRIYARWRVTVPDSAYLAYVAPLKPGPFVTAGGQGRVGRWGMIPPGSKTRKPTLPGGAPMASNNASGSMLTVRAA